jgi:predicted metal-binding protein
MKHPIESDIEAVLRAARSIGFQQCISFEAELLEPEERIRAYCKQNKCGNYQNHYMCPPHIGSLLEIRQRLRQYRRGVLLQYGHLLDVRNDLEGLKQSKLDFHQMVLRLEERLRETGLVDFWGMIGGECALCEPCLAMTRRPCPYPDRARTSLESLAIDVMSVLSRFGLDNAFRPDKINWTGCVLF